MTKTRLLLADDHRLVRAGIRSVLEKMPWIDVVAEASNGREAVELVRTWLPNLVLMDIAMSELNGLVALARITKEFPAVKVIILSMHAKEEYVLEALRAGASGYLLKDAAISELEIALHAVANCNETFLSPRISKGVINGYMERIADNPGAAQQLTARQREIVQLVAEGKNTKEIAYLLGISVKTVEAHRLQLMARLNIHDVAGLVRYAIRSGLISPEI